MLSEFCAAFFSLPIEKCFQFLKMIPLGFFFYFNETTFLIHWPLVKKRWLNIFFFSFRCILALRLFIIFPPIQQRRLIVCLAYYQPFIYFCWPRRSCFVTGSYHVSPNSVAWSVSLRIWNENGVYIIITFLKFHFPHLGFVT